MDGGAFLSAGTFGCIFDPPIRCSTKPNLQISSAKVGKLGHTSDVKNEMYASKVLSGVENSKEYFSLANQHSLCKYDDLTKDTVAVDEIGICKIRCKTIQKIGTSQMVQFIMPFGGMMIQKYFGMPAKGLVPKLNPRALIIHFLEACATMTLNDYIHYDLHPGNILFDEKTHLPRIIDFGLSYSSESINEEHLRENWKNYTPHHPFEAPEITIITGIHNRIPFNTAFQEVLNEKISLRSAQTLLGLSIVQQGKAFKQFWNNSQSALKKDWVSFFNFYWPGFDAWGAGIILITLFGKFGRDPVYYRDPEWRTTSSIIKEILRGLLQMSPERRTDCVETLAIFDPENRVLLSASGKAWLSRREKMRAAS